MKNVKTPLFQTFTVSLVLLAIGLTGGGLIAAGFQAMLQLSK